MIFKVVVGVASVLTTLLPLRVAAEPATITVQIVNYADVPARALNHARDHVKRVFDRAKVDVIWREVIDVQPSQRGVVTILVIGPTMVARKTALEGIPAGVLASSAPATRRAWVYYERVATAAYRVNLDPPIALGRVVVHELGHLIAPNMPHADSSAMEETLRTERSWVQRFTARQAETIRANLQPGGVAAPLARAR